MIKLVRKKSKKTSISSIFEVSDFIDFMIISLSSGSNITDSFVEASQILKERDILNSIKKVMEIYSVGTSFSEAISIVRDDCQHVYLVRLFDTILMSLSMGTNICESLEAISEDFKKSGKSQIEELAAKAPVKMLFPMVCFIFPAIFILLGAGVVRDFVEAFK